MHANAASPVVVSQPEVDTEIKKVCTLRTMDQSRGREVHLVHRLMAVSCAREPATSTSQYYYYSESPVYMP